MANVRAYPASPDAAPPQMPPARLTSGPRARFCRATSSRLPSNSSVAAEASCRLTPLRPSQAAFTDERTLPPGGSRIACDRRSCLLSMRRHDVGRKAAGNLATSRIQAAPRCQSGKTTLSCSTTSGRGWIRTMADVTTPRQPSLPRTRLVSSMLVDVRPNAVPAGRAVDCAPPWCCHNMPVGVATLTSTSKSSMFPYRARFMPLARVAIQPPRVENSIESGSIPIVTPSRHKASFSAAPVIPASTNARPSSWLTQTTRARPRMSSETQGRGSELWSGQAVADVTLVRPPTGMTEYFTAPPAAWSTDSTSSSLSGRTTASGTRMAAPVRSRQMSASP
mmetsp:Transcript_49087/g.140542  ORF Transcript_49087/g.140542 Transcript_49087/m.140542 type:complete len:336 (+) Transcript_49087:674-1681(+)